MAASYTAANYESELAKATKDADKNWYQVYIEDKGGSRGDYGAALVDGSKGLLESSDKKTAAAQIEFKNAETEFNDMLKALGLPPF